MVPNAALRWSPAPERVVPGLRSEPDAAPNGVWVPEGRYVRPVRVQLGITDGTLTEVLGTNVTEGLPVIVSEAPASKPGDRPADASNPFVPQLLGGRR
jgi:HlyD family secretion protein